MKELIDIKLNKDNTISSMDLVTIINGFRKAECEDYTELQHKDLMKKIRKEVEALKNLGISNERNFSPVEYVDAKGEKRPCFSITRDGMLQILNSESTFVRYKTIEYVNKLENKVKEITQNPYEALSPELKAIFTLDKKQQAIEGRIDDLEGKMTIDTNLQYKLFELAKSKVLQELGGIDAPAYKELNRKVFAKIWRDYKRIMQVPSYKDTLVKDYEKGLEVLKNWTADKETKFMIIGCNSQINFKEDM